MFIDQVGQVATKLLMDDMVKLRVPSLPFHSVVHLKLTYKSVSAHLDGYLRG